MTAVETEAAAAGDSSIEAPAVPSAAVTSSHSTSQTGPQRRNTVNTQELDIELTQVLSQKERQEPSIVDREAEIPTAPASALPSRAVSRRQSVDEQEMGLLRGGMQDRPPQLRNMFHETAFVLVVGMAQLFYSIMMGNVSMSLVHIQRAFGVEETLLPWFTGAFSVAMGAFVIIFGSVADLIGHRRVFIGGLLFLGVWALIGGFAESLRLFLVARAFQGLSCGALLPSAIGILGYTYSPGKRKNRVFSAFGSLGPIGYILGGVEGGVFSQYSDWRGMMWCVAGLSILAAGISHLVIPRPHSGSWANMKNFDFIGCLLVLTSVVCIVFGFTQGPASDWSPYTYVLLIVGVLLFAAFIYSQSRVFNPIMPLDVWSVPSFKPLMLALFLGWGAFFAWQFYATLFWIKVQNETPLKTSLYFFPNLPVGVFATFVAASTLHLMPGQIIFFLSCLAFASGPLLFALQPANAIYWAFGFPAIMISTFGPDLSFASASIFVTSSVNRRLQGTAGSLINTVTNLGGACIIGLSGVVESETNKDGADILAGYRHAWWFCFAIAMTAGLIVLTSVRIPKTKEKHHLE